MDGGNVIFKFTGDDKQLKSALGGISKTFGSVMKGIGITTAAVTTGFAAIVTESVKARGEIEQTLGGVESIFKENADIVKENADKAFKTAGVSANEYMQTVNSFGASLLQSTGNNTKEAADIADMAFRDMSDNANKFGTSMESIQNAYRGFAKQNYTMLDNLSLGYSGTKSEMERLLKDAQKLTGQKYDINNLKDVYSAIHAIQELGPIKIAGTTELEAAETLTGSLASLKASWNNLLSGTGNMGDVVESAATAFKNVLRLVEEAIPDIMENMNEWLPEIIELGVSIMGAIVQGIMDNLPMLMEMAGEMLTTLGNAFMENLPQLLDQGITILLGIINGIINALPQLIPAVAQVIMTIVGAIISHLPQILAMGVQLIINLSTGIMQSVVNAIMAINNVLTSIMSAIVGFFGRVLKAGWDLIVNLGKGIANGASNALSSLKNVLSKIWEAIKGKFTEVKNNAGNWGRDMMTGFINGIMGKLAELRERVRQIADNIRAQLHFSRPDEGPLRDYETWMPDMIKGMAASLDKAAPILTDKVRALTMDMSPTLNGSYGSYAPNVNVVVNSNYETDPLGQMVNTIKTFSNGAKNDYNYGYGG